MIIAEKTNKVQFDGNFETISVGIDEKNIAHFFRMIANLYQDPTMAVLREVGANCVDAVIEAGTKDLGWELHLPSSFDANVRFVDHGVGISHEQMIRIYSIIGASSKRGNNDLIGGFGVGKWSLCSLVNNFQAISRFNGTKSQYFISLQSSGLPDIRLIKSEATSERNGFEVKFLCPDRHIQDFNNKVQKAYRFFDVKPKVFVDNKPKAIDFALGEILCEDKTQGYAIYKKNVYTNESMVVMGGVGYRLPHEHFDKKFSKFKGLFDSGVILFAPIGEYSITPSREAIQLDDLTTTRLFNKLQAVVDSFIPKLQKDMDVFEGNTWEAKLKLKELREAFSFLPDTLKLNWKGSPLTAAAMSVKNTKVSLYSCSSWNKKISVDDSIKNIEVGKSSHLFIDDLKIGGIGRAKHFILEQKAKSGYNGYGQAFYIFKESEKKNFIAETGWIGELVKTSSLPKVPSKTTRTSNANPNGVNARIRSGRSYGINDSVMLFDSASTKDVEKFVLFSSISNKVFGEFQSTYTDSLMNYLSKESGKKTAALFLPAKEYAEFDESTFDGKPVVKFEEVIKDKAFRDSILSLSSKITWSKMNDLLRNKNWNLRSFPNLVKQVAPKTKGNDLFDKGGDLLKQFVVDDQLPHLDSKSRELIAKVDANFFSHTNQSVNTAIDDLEQLSKDVFAKYPLLVHLCDAFAYNNAKDTASAVAQYVKLVDKN